ncbi:uncharacterized protein LOC134777306 [Penaeus indicus]|uniref:uncharacterized protein LOC134777306 n=1 Tax=Penaeus indicus TaxID=29960 RepID=UPI00300C9990
MTKMVDGERERDNGEEGEEKEERKNEQKLFMMEMYVPLLPESPWCGRDARTPVPSASRAGSERWAARAELCSRYDGYGSWCACSGRDDPFPPHFRPRESERRGKQTTKTEAKKEVEKTAEPEEILTVVLASRPTALHRLLESLEASKGTDILQESVLVFASTATEELSLVCASHGVPSRPLSAPPTARASTSPSSTSPPSPPPSSSDPRLRSSSPSRTTCWWRTSSTGEVCASHGVPFEATERSSDCEGLHVALLYQSALSAALILRPKAQVVVTLEDDMLVEDEFYR